MKFFEKYYVHFADIALIKFVFGFKTKLCFYVSDYKREST
jgi:hypothetical protein